MTILQEINKWSQAQPAWQQDAIRRLYVDRTLSARDIDDLYALAKAEHGVEDPEKRAPAKLAEADLAAAARAARHGQAASAMTTKTDNRIGDRLVAVDCPSLPSIHIIDFQPVFEFDGPKPVGASVTKLPPLVISTLAQSAETLPSGEVIEERRWIVATVTHWSDELIAHLDSNSGQQSEVPSVEELADYVSRALKSFTGGLVSSGALNSLDTLLVNTDAAHRNLGHVASVRMESTCSKAGLEEFESSMISFLSALFDGHAAIELETFCDGQVSTLQLSTGDMATEALAFGSKTPIPFEIRVEGCDEVAVVLLNGASATLVEIMKAGPADLRATPGGRKDLAFLFLESEIESALSALGEPDLAYTFQDFTNLQVKLVAVECDAPSHKNIPPREIAFLLTQKWPEIFS